LERADVYYYFSHDHEDMGSKLEAIV
jgi:hypothetical protein